MKASERLAERNDILEVIFSIDDDLRALKPDKSFRAAQKCREILDIRRELSRDLNGLGFSAPGLDEGLSDRGKSNRGARRNNRDCRSRDLSGREAAIFAFQPTPEGA